MNSQRGEIDEPIRGVIDDQLNFLGNWYKLSRRNLEVHFCGPIENRFPRFVGFFRLFVRSRIEDLYKNNKDGSSKTCKYIYIHFLSFF